MAKSPYNPPNNSPRATFNPTLGGSSPRTREASPTHAPNANLASNHVGRTAGRKIASPIAAPNHRFNTSQAAMPQPPATIQPGKGQIPIIPNMNGVAKARSIPDDATLKTAK
jgi:hypothetical protein